MNKARTITTTTIDRWLIPHISGLITYADKNPMFGLTLATWLDEENWAITTTPTLNPSRYLTPDNLVQAEDVLDWIMHELSTHPEARIARSAMVTWSSEYVAPPELLQGIEKYTLPNLKSNYHPKVSSSPKLQIVIDRNWANKQTAAHVANQTLALSQQLIAVELRKAGGKVESLHPHTAEWCMAGAQTEILETDQANLLTLQDIAQTDDIHHQISMADDYTVMIGFSPNTSDTLVTDLI